MSDVAFLALVLFLGFVIAIALGAALLRAAVKALAKFTVTYWTAYKVTFLQFIASSLVGVPLQEVSRGGSGLIGQTIALIATLLVGGVIAGVMIKNPETGKIGFAKGILVTLVTFGAFLLIVTLAGVVAGFFGAALRR